MVNFFLLSPFRTKVYRERPKLIGPTCALCEDDLWNRET